MLQPELVCQIPWPNNEAPELITAVSLNSAYGVIAIGTCVGMALVDLISSSLIYTWQNSELYGRDSIPFSLPSQNSDVSPSEVYYITNYIKVIASVWRDKNKPSKLYEI